MILLLYGGSANGIQSTVQWQIIALLTQPFFFVCIYLNRRAYSREIVTEAISIDRADTIVTMRWLSE